jgi:SpoVK/Ycf46/Vps4 family AAA+-type ATPase
MFEKQLNTKCHFTPTELGNFASKTEGYSGSDIRLICKEALMRPLRKIFDQLELSDTKPDEGNIKSSLLNRVFEN